MAVRAIRVFPDPVLRVMCEPVERFDDALRKLVGDMVETMYAAPGIGLAAPQIGIERRVAVVDLTAGEKADQLLVLINPEVFSEEGEWLESEGCLSIPEIAEKVPRPMKIQVRASDLQGETVTFEAEEWLARAICHEVDHLDGILFPDRLRGLRKQRIQRALRRLLREQEKSEWRTTVSVR